MKPAPLSYHGYRFPPEIISHAVGVVGLRLRPQIYKPSEGSSGQDLAAA